MSEPPAYDLTATTLVFRRDEDTRAWVTGLANHRRLGGYLPPGGHLEASETLAECALREVREELGCDAVIIPGPSMPIPPGYPHTVCPAPWWIIDCRASADNRTPRPHRHLDHTYCAIAAGDVGEPETTAVWWTEQQIRDHPDLSNDSRPQLLAAFPLLDHLTTDLHIADGDAWHAPGALAPILDDLARERTAQDVLFGRQEFPDGTGGPGTTEAADRAKQQVADAWQTGTLTWRHILEEEFLEAMAETDPQALHTELIQTAAVAAKWAAALQRRHGRITHHVKTTGGRSEHLIRDHAAPKGETVRVATPGERDGMLMVAAYAALGQVIAHSDPAALIDLAELLHALAPSCGINPADLESLRSTTAQTLGPFTTARIAQNPPEHP
ncbi:NUDIX domain-containing protein [Actinomadura rupiterrae]|uniref:NUDIX domain-containing protein n=1 Tax=Actinomadura rupiterrae TaxID=559627 RepID=UPI0020A5DC08|nr:NUDIX domain-containing protein [Actinomadura rupiterrae]MCP2342205.1 8-oxo-dGTP pyrophosphatase MutT (NUDIX family) [Actinomadura rupiterrae]